MAKTRVPQFTKDFIPLGKVQNDSPFTSKPRMKKRLIIRKRVPTTRLLDATVALKKKLEVPDKPDTQEY